MRHQHLTIFWMPWIAQNTTCVKTTTTTVELPSLGFGKNYCLLNEPSPESLTTEAIRILTKNTSHFSKPKLKSPGLFFYLLLPIHGDRHYTHAEQEGIPHIEREKSQQPRKIPKKRETYQNRMSAVKELASLLTNKLPECPWFISVTRSSKTLEQQHAVHTEKTTQTRRAWNKFLPDFAFCFLRNSKKKFTKALSTRIVMLVRKLQTQLKEDEEKPGIAAATEEREETVRERDERRRRRRRRGRRKTQREKNEAEKRSTMRLGRRANAARTILRSHIKTSLEQDLDFPFGILVSEPLPFTALTDTSDRPGSRFSGSFRGLNYMKISILRTFLRDLKYVRISHYGPFFGTSNI